MPKKLPDDQELARIEIWNATPKVYHSHMTINLGSQVGIDFFVDQLRSQLRSTHTRLKIKSAKSGKVKTVTLPYGAEHVRRVISELSKKNQQASPLQP